MQTKQHTFSATMLQDYVNCHQRYEYKYLLKQSWPAAISEPIREYEQQLKRGKRFHALVHQYFSGLPLEVIRGIDEDEKVIGWFERFISYINKFNFNVTFSEMRLQSTLSSYKLTAVFDLIAIFGDRSVQIFDWKTSKQEPRTGQLSSRIQTALYPYVLWKNKDEILRLNNKEPIKQLKMVYWFTEYPEKPIEFMYDAQKHKETEEYLFSLIEEINNTRNGGFSLTANSKLCKYCQYRSLCDRGIKAGNVLAGRDSDIAEMDFSIDMDDIEMIGPDI